MALPDLDTRSILNVVEQNFQGLGLVRLQVVKRLNNKIDPLVNI